MHSEVMLLLAGIVVHIKFSILGPSYCLFCRSWVIPNTPLRRMAELIQCILPTMDSEGLEQYWSDFFLNVGAVQAVLQGPHDKAVEIFQRGASVASIPWSTTKAAVQVEKLTGVALVAAEIKAYLDSFFIQPRVSVRGRSRTSDPF